jgi:hypothetical protein
MAIARWRIRFSPIDRCQRILPVCASKSQRILLGRKHTVHCTRPALRSSPISHISLILVDHVRPIISSLAMRWAYTLSSPLESLGPPLPPPPPPWLCLSYPSSGTPTTHHAWPSLIHSIAPSHSGSLTPPASVHDRFTRNPFTCICPPFKSPVTASHLHWPSSDFRI